MTIQELFGIEFPIIQAPMAGVQNSELAIAVSNAGGLGSIPCAMLSAEALKGELENFRTRSDKPLNLNFFAHSTPSPDACREQEWNALFSAYYSEWDIDPATIPAAPMRMPFNQKMADLVCEYRPEVVSFHFGLPSSELIDQVRGAGAKIISSATTVEEALWLAKHGADAVIAQGVEAGGHRGMFLTDDLATQLATVTLLERITRVINLPVIAAGGIADAQGIKAALDLGAAAVQIGTAYMLCPEATTSAVHRQALKSDAARRTALTNIFSGRPARGIINRMMREIGPINQAAPAFPLATAASSPLRMKAESVGNGDFSPLWAGQNLTGCAEIPAGALTRILAGCTHRD